MGGAVATGFYGIMTGGLTFKTFMDSVLKAAQSTAMIFFIVLGAQMFNSFLAFTQAPPQNLAAWVGNAGFAPLVVLTVMLIAYLIFGCVMDSLSMILLTIPIFYPIVETLDFGLTPPEEAGIWFGILALIVVEVGLITPPVGMNLFIINSMARDIPMVATYRGGVAPFVLSDLIRVVILVAFPGITLWLVGVMF